MSTYIRRYRAAAAGYDVPATVTAPDASRND